MKAAGFPVRCSISRIIMSCPAEKLLQLLIELMRKPSASYSLMYCSSSSIRCGRLRFV